MDARDLFLAQHAFMHSAAVGGNKMSAAERTFGGVTDEQMRLRPREDLNSLAWLLWHIARAEDIIVIRVLAGQPQVFDDMWMKRLNVNRRDLGTGMTSAEVSELTRQIDLGALREYRDAVGRRAREIVGGFKDQDWQGNVTADNVQRAVNEGLLGPRAEILSRVFSERPRAMVLSAVALFHSGGHMGEAGTVRAAGGFGSGI